ncbi:MAG: methyltransferase [Salinivirgaceae bacterium]|jgi:tRNA1Val (adenine37-N6)-methyltransferase|nr:methyltransferase [Salinivirgaceae bacterium]
MANNYFKFKHFTIIQEKSAMKVGTDGVLLGAWADCTNTTNILDIGTGTGLIALMLAQRSGGNIDAVEINKDAAEEAKLNIESSSWSNINLHCCSIQDFSIGRNATYDLIVSNPPYFTQSQKATTEARTYARHNDSLSPEALFNSVNNLLKKTGKFCVVIPSEDFENCCNVAASFQLYCTKKLCVKPTPSKDTKRVLLEFRKTKLKISVEVLIVEDRGRHQYSDNYKELTKDFYLAF